MPQKTEDQWNERFGEALAAEDDSTFFNNFGEHLEAVQKADPNTVWSILEGDEGMNIAPGFHMVNNIGYVLSELPHTPEDVASGEWDEVIWDGRDPEPEAESPAP